MTSSTRRYGTRALLVITALASGAAPACTASSAAGTPHACTVTLFENDFEDGQVGDWVGNCDPAQGVRVDRVLGRRARPLSPGTA